MALQYIKAKSSILPRLFSPTYDAIFSTIPLWQRWRTLLLQPINLLVALITAPTWLFNNRYSVIYVPTRSGSKRCLVYQPHRTKKHAEPQKAEDSRPLHIDIHGGGYIGGIPEQNARWCAYLSDRSGAVVISLTYRVAPRYIYPAAHDDIDDIVAYLIVHASSRFGANPELMTIGGASVGAALALSTTQFLLHRRQVLSMPKAWLGFCSSVDLSIRPEDKPKPPGYPTSDPLSFLMPMYDVYAGTNRGRHAKDARLHPTLMAKEDLPRKMLFVVAGIDILANEQISMVERVRKEVEDSGEAKRVVEVMFVENGFHGFLELPKFILEKERMEVFERSVEFISEVHRKGGFDVNKVD
ncbi:Nn.00g111300.m01.CDS01 [Neocucurbitaria sp. VM-36]